MIQTIIEQGLPATENERCGRGSPTRMMPLAAMDRQNDDEGTDADGRASRRDSQVEPDLNRRSLAYPDRRR